ncbi:MAG: hypothetical protein ACI9A7_000311 [Cyclobacteriaceae bacterium]
MRLYILSIFLLFVNAAQSQGQLHGSLLDSTTNEIIPFAHIRNVTLQVMTVSDHLGKFQIVANVQDTIIFSSVGYQRLGWIVKEDYFHREKTYRLPIDTILLKDVTINSMLTEERFKKAILNYEPEDNGFWYHGMETPKPDNDPTLSENFMKHPLAFVAHPLSAFYYRFSKQEKEKRKYHQVSQQSSIKERVGKKFTRTWVTEVTALTGDELTNFIAYCDFSLDYLDNTPFYIIQEDMLALLPKFKKNYKS